MEFYAPKFLSSATWCTYHFYHLLSFIYDILLLFLQKKLPGTYHEPKVQIYRKKAEGGGGGGEKERYSHSHIDKVVRIFNVCNPFGMTSNGLTNDCLSRHESFVSIVHSSVLDHVKANPIYVCERMSVMKAMM